MLGKLEGPQGTSESSRTSFKVSYPVLTTRKVRCPHMGSAAALTLYGFETII